MLALRPFRFIPVLAVCLLIPLTACSDDDDNNQTNGNDAAVVEDAAVDAAPDAGLELPDTPAANRLQWFVDALNDGTLNEAVYQESFTQEYQDAIPYTDFAGYLTDYAMDWAPLVITGHHEPSATDTVITGYVHGEGSDMWMYILVAVEAADPYRIRNFFTQPTPDLDPDYGPPGASEVDVFPELFSMYLTPANYTVELLDASTGDSFDPPATGTVDPIYLHARLPWPSGATDVGIRVTSPGGESFNTYGVPVEPGQSGRVPWAFAMPDDTIQAWANTVQVTADASAAHVLGLIRYTWPNPFDMFIEPMHIEDVMVGCASVSANPALPAIYYNDADTGSFSETLTETTIGNSLFIAFNLDPVAHVFTVDADGELVQMTLPPLVAGEMTFLWLTYDADVLASNPTPAGCGTP